jgi:hypothetical protein
MVVTMLTPSSGADMEVIMLTPSSGADMEVIMLTTSSGARYGSHHAHPVFWSRRWLPSCYRDHLTHCTF